MLGLPTEAAPTAVGLRILLGPQRALPLDPQRLASQLYPSEPLRLATERIILHILMLEEAGHVRTWAQHGREWISMRDPHEAPTSTPQGTAHPSPAPTPDALAAGPFSPAGEREKGREEARARARERARAQAAAEDLELRERWAAWDREYATPRTAPTRPERPLLLNAPPIGCPDHPTGSLEPCGPCGTAMERRTEWKVRQRYQEQLTDFEEWLDNDTPF